MNVVVTAFVLSQLSWFVSRPELREEETEGKTSVNDAVINIVFLLVCYRDDRPKILAFFVLLKSFFI